MNNTKQKKSFYAIFYRDTRKTFIVKTWPECQRIMRGHNNYMRGFHTEAEAQAWLSSLSEHKASSKVTYHIRLTSNDNDQLVKRLVALNMTPTELIENLILEYMYDN